jgi:hypothetical protein
VVTDATVREKIRSAWAKWQRSKHYYSDESMCWERCVKPQVQRLLRQEEADRRAHYRAMENHLHECLYDVLRSEGLTRDNLPLIKIHKA